MVRTPGSHRRCAAGTSGSDGSPEAAESTHAILSTFAQSVSPVLDELAAMATAEPGGSVAAALRQLRRAQIALDRHGPRS